MEFIFDGSEWTCQETKDVTKFTMRAVNGTSIQIPNFHETFDEYLESNRDSINFDPYQFQYCNNLVPYILCDDRRVSAYDTWDDLYYCNPLTGHWHCVEFFEHGKSVDMQLDDFCEDVTKQFKDEIVVQLEKRVLRLESTRNIQL